MTNRSGPGKDGLAKNGLTPDRIGDDSCVTDQPVTPTKADQNVETPSRREQILDAAISVFSTRGYRETLVDEIAQRAGVAKGTVYLYFKSKEEIYFEAFRENIEKLHQLTVARIGEADSTWEKIKAFASVRLELSETQKAFLRIYLSEFVGTLMGRGEWSEQVRTMLRRESEVLHEVFRNGIEAGEVRPLPVDQLVTMVRYLVGGIVTSRISEIRLSDGQLDLDMILDLLRRGLGMSEQR